MEGGGSVRERGRDSKLSQSTTKQPREGAYGGEVREQKNIHVHWDGSLDAKSLAR